MKKKDNILSILFLITIYCFGIGFSAPKTVFPYDWNEIGNTGKEQLSELSKPLCFHTPTTETSLSVIRDYPNPSFNPNFEGFWTILQTSELRFIARFKQYKAYFKTILIRHRKSDLIFPFHLFW
ncbi:hypothetical protein Q4566_13295 [Tamlana sp. 2_MG-2023]|uniref:hypothetical protein n=1 Tax=unclassified Tamlana TaxID=2614803 RepID=UPI0026E28AE5|nr:MULTISPECIES: hypothetical protein [unclassified Tamlana]MDO6761180.1 hypothetical protein [Tamlana sp. 2_MG-2023]MDO6791487.1 hypothetical protein [Tamlana sp. 1_MG-2023]